VVDDPDMFLTATQVAALVDATPWPCAVMVHLPRGALGPRCGWAVSGGASDERGPRRDQDKKSQSRKMRVVILSDLPILLVGRSAGLGDTS
jgi:hypothetical protein